MVNKLWSWIGRAAYIFAWPVIYLILNNSQRTRILVYSDEKLLVVKDWLGDGSWKLPGGGIHQGEPPAVSAQRELLEETGINLPAARLKSLGTIDMTHRKVKSLMHIYTTDIPAGTQIRKHSTEIIDIAWFTAEQLAASKISNNTKSLLDKFGSRALR